jgi:hypothetical protein
MKGKLGNAGVALRLYIEGDGVGKFHLGLTQDNLEPVEADGFLASFLAARSKNKAGNKEYNQGERSLIHFPSIQIMHQKGTFDKIALMVLITLVEQLRKGGTSTFAALAEGGHTRLCPSS